MKHGFLAATVLLAIPTAANAQLWKDSAAQPAQLGRSNTAFANFSNRDPGSLDRTRTQRECLIEKATKRRVCRTRDEWERIAKRIDNGQSWR
ncbi:hypothetical protein [Sphingomonas sp. G-3-2-10]|uniref:hypothetical protein n=1 Tax=Sphingomonas sp. G-3-2-10 TaxID=2728838 RepID=UPI00146AA8C9|nr:hypothetical protein [Sphingomonas sp. G-3-2-10]NML05481.1 hypothetical protein [Sphingomonas sp. G-3-2-10]